MVGSREAQTSATSRGGCGPLIAPLSESMRPLRQQIFERVRAGGLMPRVQVARELGVSAASVTMLTSELIESGFLQEVPAPRCTGCQGGRLSCGRREAFRCLPHRCCRRLRRCGDRVGGGAGRSGASGAGNTRRHLSDAPGKGRCEGATVAFATVGDRHGRSRFRRQRERPCALVPDPWRTGLPAGRCCFNSHRSPGDA